MRKIQPILSEQTDRGVEETHPAFGVAVVTRGHGGAMSLFQSDVQHQEFITLSIRTAERTRDLNRDWVHPREEIVEVRMSMAQWGALVSSVGLGSGVPVTITSTPDNRMVPGIPFEPRIAASLDEVRGSVGKMLEEARASLADLTEAIEQKKGVVATREALRKHTNKLAQAEGNAEFAVTSLTEAAEDVVNQARVDIESHILAAHQQTGLASPIIPPTLTLEEN